MTNDASLDMGLPPNTSRLYGRSGRAALTAGTLTPVGDNAAREDVHGNVEVRDFDGYDADDMKHAENLVEAKKADLIRECNEVIREWEAEADAVRQARLRRWQTVR